MPPPFDLEEVFGDLDRNLKNYYKYCVWKKSDPMSAKENIAIMKEFVEDAFGPKTENGTLNFMDTEFFSCVILCEKQNISDRIINHIVEYYTPTIGDTIRPCELMRNADARTIFQGVNNALDVFLNGNHIPIQNEVLYNILTSGIFLCPVVSSVGEDEISMQLINDIVRFGILLPYLFSKNGAHIGYKEPYSYIAELIGKMTWSEGDYAHVFSYLRQMASDPDIKHWCIFVILPYDSFDIIQRFPALAEHPYIKRIIRIEEYPALLKNTIYIANTDQEKIKAEIESNLRYLENDKDALQFHRDLLLKLNDPHIIFPLK